MNDRPFRPDNSDHSILGLAAESQRMLMELPEVAFYGIASDYTVTFMSPSCRNVLGVDPEEAIGDNVLQKVHVDDRDMVLQAVARARTGGGVASVEFRCLNAAGSQIWVNTTIYRTSGDIPKAEVICVTQDVTSKKLGEALLKIAHSLEDAMASCDSSEELHSMIPKQIKQLEGTICCGLQLQDGLSGRQVVMCEHVHGSECQEFLRRIGAGPRVADRLNAGQPVVVDLEDYEPQVVRDSLATARSFVGVPVRHGRSVFGSLLMSSTYPSKYLESNVDLLMTIANHIGAETQRLRQGRGSDDAGSVSSAQSVWELKNGTLVLSGCNERANEITMSALGNLVGRTVDELLAHSPQLLHKMYLCARTGKRQEYHDWYQFRHCEREARILRIRIEQLDPGRIEVSADDVTDQPFVQVCGPDYDRLGHLMLDTLRACTAMVNADGRLLIMNDTMAQVCRVDAHTSIGRSLSTVLPGGLYSLLKVPVASAWRLHSDLSFSCRWEDRCYEWRLTPVTSDGSDGARLAIVGRDVTGRVDAMRAVEDSERRYRLLAENARDMISLHDAEGIYEYVSPACVSILGYEPEELVGRNPYDFIHPEDRLRVSQKQDVVMQAAGNHTIEYRMRNTAGSWVWVESTAYTVPGDTDDSDPHIVCVTRNISRRKKTEAELKATLQKLEAKQIALTEILGRIEDEKRAATRAVYGRIRETLLPAVVRLRREAPSELTEEIRSLEEKLSQITQSGTEPLDDKLAGLTEREIDVCLLIRDGLSSKDIGLALNVSALTVNKHRESIRRKLGLQHKRINLRSYLRRLNI